MRLQKTIPLLLIAVCAQFFLSCTSPTGTKPPINGSTANGNYYIYSPIADTVVRTGSNVTVKWIPWVTPTHTYAKICLYKDSQLVSILSPSAHDSSYSVYVSTTIASGKNYRIKLYDYYDTTRYDYGPYFTIASQYDGTITISNPADTTTIWTAGTTDTIKWDTTGNIGSSVYIQLYNDSGLVYYIPYGYASSIYNYNYYAWTIPAGTPSGSYRIRVLSYYDSSISATSKKFTIASTVAADAYENDNSISKATALTLGTVQQHTITYNDTDWVSFSADSGSQYIITDAGTYNYAYLYYGTNATTYTTYFYNYSSSTSSTWICTKTGTYYLKVVQYSTLYYGPYSLKITKYDPTTAVTFTNPTATTTMSANNVYTISWTPDTTVLGTYVTLYLYKGNQQISYIYSYSSNSGSYSWTVPAGVLTGSDYKIKIVNYNNSTLYGLSQQFSISGISADAFEYDNIRDSAKAITLGTAQSRSLSLNDTDWISFSADSGSQYIFNDAGTYNYVYLFFGTDAASTTYFYNYNYTSSMWTCVKSGTYYARVTPYSTAYSGSYTFKVTKYDPLTSISFSSPTTTTTWSTGTTNTISWIPDTSILGTSVYLYIYKGNQFLSSIYSYTVSNSGTYSWTIPASLASGSDYRVRIVNYNYSTQYGISPAFSISGITPDAYEYDNVRDSAKSITTDGTAQSRSLTLGDTDWISFTAEKDSIYLIRSAGSITGTNNCYQYLYLYNSSGTSMSNYSGTYSGYSPKLIWTCPASGTYYIKNYTPSTSYYGTYSLSVKKYSATSIVTFTNPTAAATLNAGTAYSIQWIADTALFGTYVTLNLTQDTNQLLSINTYLANTTGTGSYSWTVPTMLGSGNNYHIRITSYSNSAIRGLSAGFTISGIAQDAYEPDNSAATAHAITINGGAENHTLPFNDTDYCQFSATANYLYVLKANGSIKPAMTLYNTNGTTLLTSANTAYTDTAATIAWFCPTAGTYYFRTISALYGSYQISATGNDTSAYRITVTSPATNDSLTIGQTYSIKWSSTITIGDSVDIFLYNNGNISTTIVSGVKNSGTYSWTVPSTITAGTTYSVKVSNRLNPSYIIGYSGVFVIKQ